MQLDREPAKNTAIEAIERNERKGIVKGLEPARRRFLRFAIRTTTMAGVFLGVWRLAESQTCGCNIEPQSGCCLCMGPSSACTGDNCVHLWDGCPWSWPGQFGGTCFECFRYWDECGSDCSYCGGAICSGMS